MGQDKIIIGRDSQGRPLGFEREDTKKFKTDAQDKFDKSAKDKIENGRALPSGPPATQKTAGPPNPTDPDIKTCEVRMNIENRHSHYESLRHLPQAWANSIGGTSKLTMPVAPDESQQALEQLDGKRHAEGGQKPGDQVAVIKSNGRMSGIATVIKCTP